MYIKRKSVAARQKKAIADSLRRLEETAFTASSSSTDEAAIRAKEAEMVSKFVERAKAVEPEGVVVLDGGPDKADLALEDGDIIVIPPKSDVVLVSGEVMPKLVPRPRRLRAAKLWAALPITRCWPLRTRLWTR